MTNTFTAPVLASDLRTRTALRVFACANGGSIAVNHVLNLIRYEDLFITGNCETGFKVMFEGITDTYKMWGDAVEVVRNCIGSIHRYTVTGSY
jgi:hypothetical protein